jgi:hypothetical protein
MIKKFIFLVLLMSLSSHSQVCSDFPEITATQTTICSGLSTTLSVVYTPPEICNMNITPTTIPLGNPIPGFSYGGLYNGHYYYVYNTPTSWTQGELICRQNGGYLVCINDINENQFVSNLTNNNIWIGLFRDPTTCQFRWLDCMDINFTNWRPGEPNSGPCGEPYTQIIRGCSFGLNTWNNLDDNAANGSCYSNMVPIMEIDPIIYNNPISNTTTYLWSTGETTNSINILPTTTSNYWVDITSGSVTCRKNITINVNPDTPAPTGNPTQVFCISPAPSVADLTVTGSNIQWYASATGGTPLASSTVLVDGTPYYASQTLNGCESNSRLEVTVNINNPQILASATTICDGTSVDLEVNAVPTPSQGPRWELLIPATNYNGNQINLSETGYDRNNNYIFSLFKQGSNLITYRFNLNNNTVSNITTTNVPSNIGPFTYDYTNNRLITGRTGRDPIFAVSANGGAWSQIGTGSFDQESYGAQYYWNSNNQKTGFFGGYGFFAVKNWLWENGGSWSNPFVNNNNCGPTIPAKRNTQLALGAPNVNKIYFFSGQGSCSGQQTASSCNLGSPWATDVGIYCWLKDLWELDLNTYSFTNILPVNNSSITKEGGFVYNYSENSFYIIGGYNPSPTYNPNIGNIANFETTVLKYNPAINTGFVPFNVQGTPPPTVTLNNLGNNKTYFDATNNQIVWIRKDGVWAIKLDTSSNSTSILWSTGETSPTINVTPTTTSTYWVDVTVNGVTCRKEITITVNPNTTPTFTQVVPICNGATLNTLPTNSNNGITGTWSPSLNNTATTTYTFTPNVGQCATSATMTITINPLPAIPTGNAQQLFCAIDEPTINDLVLITTNINWYTSASGGSVLNSNFPLTNGLVLFAAAIDPITLCENPSRYQVQVQVENPVLPTIEVEQEFCIENSMTLGAINTNGTTMNWYDNPTGGSVVSTTHVLQNGDVFYGAAINSVSGCESTTRIPLEITIVDSNLSFFNLITIDDNDLNEELIIQGLEQFPNNSIEIYNRYGNLVWSGINYDNITNTFKGMASVSGVVSQGSYLPTGTYFFILSYPNDCEKSELKGFIQIDNKR